AGMKTYRFEMDTSYQAFGNPPQYSPMFRFATVTDSGGVITWNNNIQLLDSVVYYWRVANDSVQNNPARYKWRESSFIYIPNKTGWSQKHFYQFNEDHYVNVIPDSINRKFNFVQNNKTLAVTDFGQPANAAELNSTGYTLNNSVGESNGCQVTPAVLIAVIDSISLNPWSTCDNNFNQANPFTLDASSSCSDAIPHVTTSCNGRNRTENYFIFRYNDATQMSGLATLLNAVPNGDYILAYSWFTSNYS